MQALQYTGDAPVSANREFEIRGLKEEIETLKKQIAGKKKNVSTTLVMPHTVAGRSLHTWT